MNIDQAVAAATALPLLPLFPTGLLLPRLAFNSKLNKNKIFVKIDKYFLKINFCRNFKCLNISK